MSYLRAAEDDAVVVALAVEVHVHQHAVVDLLDRVVDVVQADHLGVPEFLVHALVRDVDVELRSDLPPEHDRAGDGRDQHGRVSLVGLGLERDAELAAFLGLVLAQAGDALLEVLVHLLDRDGRDVVAEGAVPDHEGRRLVVTPRLAESAVGQIDGPRAQLFGGLALRAIHRADAAVGEVRMRAGRDHRQRQLVADHGVGHGLRVVVVDFRVVVQLDAELNVLGHPGPDPLGDQLNHLRGAEFAAGPVGADVAGDEAALARVERPSAYAV